MPAGSRGFAPGIRRRVQALRATVLDAAGKLEANVRLQARLDDGGVVRVAAAATIGRMRGDARNLLLVLGGFAILAGCGGGGGDAGSGRAQGSLADWTPPAIAADPAAFLTFAAGQTVATLQQLDEAAAAAAGQRAALEVQREEGARALAGAEAQLASLKSLYRTAQANGMWPVSWQGRRHHPAQLERAILDVDAAIGGHRDALARIDAGLATLQQRLAAIEQARNGCRERLQRIERDAQRIDGQAVDAASRAELAALRDELAAAAEVARAPQGGLAVDTAPEPSAAAPAPADHARFAEIMKH